MRPLFLALALAGCATASTVHTPVPTPALTAHGVPPRYEACAQRTARLTRSMYDVYSECREELVYYVVGLPISLESKSEMVDQMERRAMNRAQEVVTAIHGARAMF